MSSPARRRFWFGFRKARANAHPRLPGLFSKANRLFSRFRSADRLGYAVMALGIGSPSCWLQTAFSPQKRRKRPIGSPSRNVTLTLRASRSCSSRGLPGGGTRRSGPEQHADPKPGRERGLDDMQQCAWFVPPFLELSVSDYLRTTESASEYRGGFTNALCSRGQESCGSCEAEHRCRATATIGCSKRPPHSEESP